MPRHDRDRGARHQRRRHDLSLDRLRPGPTPSRRPDACAHYRLRGHFPPSRRQKDGQSRSDQHPTAGGSRRWDTIWRGVAFEFRFKADAAHQAFWDKAFAWGSYVATFCQGAAVGAFINGFKVDGPSYQGGAFDWLTPFSVFTGLGLMVAYALLGCTWLVMKTEGALEARMRAVARWATLALLGVIGIVSLWTPLSHPAIAQRWFILPNLLFFAPVPGLTLAMGLLLLFTLRQRGHIIPFLAALALLFLGYTGLAISLWPHIVPPDLTIEAAAAPPQSQLFVLVGALVIIPVILAYTGFAYYVFRGKVRAGEGYH